MIVLLNSLNSKSLEVRNTSEKREKILAKSKKLDEGVMKMRSCVIPNGQTDAGSSQKHFLPFRVLLSFKIDPNFPQKRFIFALYQEKVRFLA